MGGAFITFEGTDGAGKSTQARRLRDRLAAAGHPVTLTREPGGSRWAETLRAALLSERGAALSAREQALLFAAARADHVAALIAPTLADGVTVICDRFADSTEAYQGVAGVPAPLLALLSRMAVGATRPDLTFILDCPVSVGQTRMEARGGRDTFDKDAADIQEARRQAFLAIAAREPERCVVIDAAGTADEIADAIWQAAEARLGLGAVPETAEPVSGPGPAAPADAAPAAAATN